MFQNMIPQEYTSCFRGAPPKPIYVWKKSVGDTFAVPRIMHRHTDITEFILITTGEIDYTIAERHYSIREGDLILINAGVLHDEDARLAAASVIGVGIRGLKLVGLPDDVLIPIGAKPVFSLGKAYPIFREIMDTIHTLSDTDPKASVESCQLLTESLIAMFVRLFRQHEAVPEQETKDRMLTTRIRDYLETHYTEDLTLPSIAAELHMNAYYLAHVFKDSTGYSPMQYAVRLRIGKAQEMLAFTGYPITYIAGAVGYDNSSYFNTVFTKHIGMSPGKYRKTFVPPEEK